MTRHRDPGLPLLIKNVAFTGGIELNALDGNVLISFIELKIL